MKNITMALMFIASMMVSTASATTASDTVGGYPDSIKVAFGSFGNIGLSDLSGSFGEKKGVKKSADSCNILHTDAPSDINIGGKSGLGFQYVDAQGRRHRDFSSVEKHVMITTQIIGNFVAESVGVGRAFSIGKQGEDGFIAKDALMGTYRYYNSDKGGDVIVKLALVGIASCDDLAGDGDVFYISLDKFHRNTKYNIEKNL